LFMRGTWYIIDVGEIKSILLILIIKIL